MMPFIDRTDAGRQLAKALARYKNQRPVVLALPRGGVPVAAEVATKLDAPLDLILVPRSGALSPNSRWARSSTVPNPSSCAMKRSFNSVE
jgi:predicted phosphoribosyltransferase